MCPDVTSHYCSFCQIRCANETSIYHQSGATPRNGAKDSDAAQPESIHHDGLGDTSLGMTSATHSTERKVTTMTCRNTLQNALPLRNATKHIHRRLLVRRLNDLRIEKTIDVLSDSIDDK